ncbi:MAG: hypothetical protein ABSD71_15385 [Bacteroidales bacterium]
MISRIFKSTSILLLLLVFLAGSTGISISVHTCGDSHKKNVLVFKEIFNQKFSCCCEENAALQNDRNQLSAFAEYSDNDCCRISHLFIKAPFAGFPILEKFSVPQFDFPVYTERANLKLTSLQDSKSSYQPFSDPSPPPLSGIKLIISIHQIRIPESVC